MAGGAQQSGRTVLSKALAILGAFEFNRRSLSQSELVEATGLPQPTVHRLAGELVAWGALMRDPQGRYQIGMRLWELSQNAGRQLRETSRPFVQDLHDLTGQTSQLAVRDGLEVLYIDRVYGSHRVPRASRVGGRLPIHATAVGRAILSFEEPWVRESVVDAGHDRLTARTVVSPSRLREELEQVREQGWAATYEEVRPGACSIAVPVFGCQGAIGAGLGLVVPSSSADTMQRYLPTLRGVSKALERATSHVPLTTILRTVQSPP